MVRVAFNARDDVVGLKVRFAAVVDEATFVPIVHSVDTEREKVLL
jgi:hypothetical protein